MTPTLLPSMLGAGHLKVIDKMRRKGYLSIILQGGKAPIHISRKVHKTATLAKAYAERIINRYQKLVSNQSTQKEVQDVS